MRRLFIKAGVLKRHCEHFKVISAVLKYLSEGSDIKLYRSTSPSETNAPFLLNREICGRFKRLNDLYTDNCFLSISADKIPPLINDVNKEVFYGLSDEHKNTIHVILKMIFDYDAFSRALKLEFVNFKDGKAIKHSWNKTNGDESWGAGYYLKALDVRYCVYCNAETLYAVNYKAWQDKNVALKGFLVNHSAFDHFYCYDEYPYLGLTLSNLVPSCTRCNSGMKGEKDFTHMLNPYLDDFHLLDYFAYSPDTTSEFYGEPDLSRLTLQHRNNSETEKNKLAECFTNNFYLLEVYRDIYALEVADIILRRNSLRKTLFEMHNKRLDIPTDMLMQISGLCISPEDINKHRFGKLIVDLCNTVM